MLAPTGFWIPAGAQYIVATGGYPRQDQALPLSRAPPSSDEGVKSRRGHSTCGPKHWTEYTAMLAWTSA